MAPPKRRKGAGAPKASTPLLEGAERIRALVWCEDQIGLLQRRGEVLARLIKRHNVSQYVAATLYTEAMASYKDLWSAGRPERATTYERQLQGLFRLAIRNRDLAVADRILGKMGRMWGVEGALVVEQTTSAGSEFSDRTDADLEHFTQYGSWPEQPAGGAATH